METIGELKNWVKQHLYNQDKLILSRLTKTWFKLNVDENIQNLIEKFSPIKTDKIYPKIFCIINDISEYPKCICGNPLSWQRTHFSKFCCSSCANKHTAKKGDEAHIKQDREKIKKIMIEKYGVDNPFKIKEIQNKIKETNKQKFGGQPMHCKEVKEKQKQTCLEKYGVEHFSKTDKFKQIMVDYNQKNIPKDVLEKLENPEWLRYQHHELKKPQIEIARELGVSQGAVWERCIKYNIESLHVYSISSAEKEIESFLNELNISNLRNVRNIIPPKELDFYIPNKNLAIEYNGIYYHSSARVDKNHHLEKTNLCIQHNIDLLHIYEDEWNNKKEIWKSIICNKLNKNITVIYARNCTVDKVDFDKAKIFLEENHLQGSVNSSIIYGLFYNNELISLMSFNNSRFTKKYEYELMRFCTKKYFRVTGGASKLFSYFIQNHNPKSIISYADRRYSNGNLYKNLGFALTHITDPSYSYVIGNKLESREKFQKHKLKNILQKYDDCLSEEQNMYLNGYYRIYNSGQMAFEWLNIDI